MLNVKVCITRLLTNGIIKNPETQLREQNGDYVLTVATIIEISSSNGQEN